MKDLTYRQAEVLEHIKSFLLEHHRTPRGSDIAIHFNIHPNAAWEHIKALEGKGVIERVSINGSARHIKLIGYKVELKTG